MEGDIVNNVEAFKNSKYYNQLRQEILHSYRIIGHVLDNYGMNMEEGLKEALERLWKDTEDVLEHIKQ